MKNEELNKIIEKEGDYKKFTYKGVSCEIKRITSLGHLCGYIKLPLEYSDPESIPCHGGVTFCEEHNDYIEIGFDCAHYQDLSPFKLGMGMGGSDGTYRTMEYCENELKSMVDYVYENGGSRIKLLMRRINK